MSYKDGQSDNLDWWYDAQIKRYMTQVVRLFSQFRVREYTRDGEYYNRVPARYADASRLVSHIVRNNSENIINSSPMITCAISAIRMSPELRHHPHHVDTAQVTEREFDYTNNQYTNNAGNLYTVQKYMPTPYIMDLQVDVWTTNTDTKLQLLEQIMVIFNPGVQIQDHKNAMDWSSVFEVTMKDLSWSNRSIPTGVDDVLDISTLNFEATIWINPPTKVRRQQIIQTIIKNTFANEDVEGLGYDAQIYDFFRTVPEEDQKIITPKQYECLVEDGKATLIDPQGDPANWRDLIEMTGYLNEGSVLKLNTTNDVENQVDLITGSISYTSNPNVLSFTEIADTIAPDTLDPLTRIVNPDNAQPDNGLPSADFGQRYLLTADIHAGNTAWNGSVAKADDIIQYNGSSWAVVFDSSETSDVFYITNNNTGKQYVYTGSQWQNSWEGQYNPGFWRLYL